MYVNGRICFGIATPTCMRDHESLEGGGALVEMKWKWMWLRQAHRKGKKVTRSLLRKAKNSSSLGLSFVCFACVMTT